MSAADYDTDSGEWARIALRVWLVTDLQRTLRAARQQLVEHAEHAPGLPALLEDLSYQAGLLGWHLHQHRTQPAHDTTTPPAKESSR